jgi:predicted acetyltransferase
MPGELRMTEAENAIARAPKKDELEEAANIGKIAFQSETIDPWLNSYNWIAEHRGLDYLIVVEADGKLTASMLCTPGIVRFQNDLVPLSAVGGVATLPEYRNKGHAALMMERSVRLLYDAGYHTSALWPFSYHYYRKFGWEVGCEHRKYTISSELASQLSKPDGTRPIRAEDLQQISKLVDRFSRNHNCVTVRDELWWSCIRSIYVDGFSFDGNANPKESRCPWVHESDGKIDGYCLFSVIGEGEQSIVDIKELVADTVHARWAILSRMSQVGAATISFSAPIHDEFLQEIPNPRVVGCQIEAGFQFRVINPRDALELRSASPGVSGKIGLDITDPVLSHFDFDIEASEGHIKTASSIKGERLFMDIQTFSQIYSGYMSPVRAAELGRLKTSSDAALKFMDSLLPKAKPFRSFVELG